MSTHSAPSRAPLPPAICVHSRSHALLALAPGRPVTLLSAPGAALFAGPAWWRAIVECCETSQPDIIDCADAPGRALEAIALGCRRIVLQPCPAWIDIARRAADTAAILLDERPPSLDLADPAAVRHIEAWLQVG